MDISVGVLRWGRKVLVILQGYDTFLFGERPLVEVAETHRATKTTPGRAGVYLQSGAFRRKVRNSAERSRSFELPVPEVDELVDRRRRGVGSQFYFLSLHASLFQVIPIIHVHFITHKNYLNLTIYQFH